MDDEILEPLREYATSLREKHKTVTEEIGRASWRERVYEAV